jgi:predicted phage-related endonuclease
MADLANWHDVRNGVTTASNIAALAKLSRYESPWSLYQRRKGLLPPVEETEAMWFGTALEPVIMARTRIVLDAQMMSWADFAALIPELPKVSATMAANGTTIVETDRCPVLINERLGTGGTPDGVALIDGKWWLVECKTVGYQAHCAWAKSDGEATFDGLRPPQRELPDGYVTQPTVYCGLLGLAGIVVPVLVAGQRLDVYRVEFDAELFDGLCTLSQNAAAVDEPPEFDPYRDGERVGQWAAMVPATETVTIDDPEFITLAREANAFGQLAKRAETESKARRAALLHRMVEAGIAKATVPGVGKVSVTTLKAVPERTVVQKARAATAYARIALGKDAETTTAIEAASEQVRMLALSDKETEE